MIPAPRGTLLVLNIGQLITMAGDSPRRGESLKELGMIKNAGLAISNNQVIAVGESEEIERRTQLVPGCRVIDAGGRVVTPGFIDVHTHPVYASYRADEFEQRIQGATYQEIAEAGGGILSTVRVVRQTPQEQLQAHTAKRFDRLLEYGVTTIEAKSGYGLKTEDEIKSLRVLRKLQDVHPLELVTTFLGAHEVPAEYRAKRTDYIKLLINEMIPAVQKENLAEFSDIFCEPGVFSIDESRQIQSAAKSAGFKLRFHADEFAQAGGAELAVEMGARSADHLMQISDHGIAALAKSNTVAVMLPGTSYTLGAKTFAPARKLIDAGAIVALSTDCNPGSSCTESLQFICSLASVHLKLSAAESISAVTVNAAYAIDRSDTLGQLVSGKQADAVIWDMEDYRELPYHYGMNHARLVIKRGKVVVDRLSTATK